MMKDLNMSVHFSDTSVDLNYNNDSVHVSLIPNPSHLEVSVLIAPT